jgi:hypothetical protein
MEQLNQKKNLMSSVNYLENNVMLLEDLFYLSKTLIQKLERTEGLENSKDNPIEPVSKTPIPISIVDLFNIKIDKMSELMNLIRENIQQVINIVE